MLTVDGIPAHPLVVHAVVVLLPLAAVGTVLVAARPLWRRQLGIWVLLLTLAGVASVPVAQTTGAQLAESLGGGGPLVMEHAMRGSTLLLPAVLFLALLAATVFVGRRADAQSGDAPGAAHAVATRTASLQRITLILGVLAALAGLAVAGMVMWIGHAGATAVWGA